jgi:hypothetical protein
MLWLICIFIWRDLSNDVKFSIGTLFFRCQTVDKCWLSFSDYLSNQLDFILTLTIHSYKWSEWKMKCCDWHLFEEVYLVISSFQLTQHSFSVNQLLSVVLSLLYQSVGFYLRTDNASLWMDWMKNGMLWLTFIWRDLFNDIKFSNGTSLFRCQTAVTSTSDRHTTLTCCVKFVNCIRTGQAWRVDGNTQSTMMIGDKYPLIRGGWPPLQLPRIFWFTVQQVISN